MTLGNKIIEMLEEGYGIYLYWEPNLSGDKNNDCLVVDVLKEGESMKSRFVRSGFFMSPADLILMAFQDVKEGFEAENKIAK